MLIGLCTYDTASIKRSKSALKWYQCYAHICKGHFMEFTYSTTDAVSRHYHFFSIFYERPTRRHAFCTCRFYICNCASESFRLRLCKTVWYALEMHFWTFSVRIYGSTPRPTCFNATTCWYMDFRLLHSPVLRVTFFPPWFAHLVTSPRQRIANQAIGALRWWVLEFVKNLEHFT